MPKTVTILPIFTGLNNTDTDSLYIKITPFDALRVHRGMEFNLRVKIDKTQVLGPDGAVIEAPVPDSIAKVSIDTGSATIQAQIDTWDAAGLLDKYY